MLSFRASLTAVLFTALAASHALATPTHPAPANSSHTKHHTHKKVSPKLRGQQVIDPARVMEIQQALIRVHYMTGEATGKWDEATKAAMQKFQADQGWQTKLMPDARALKKLGLGPDYSNAINAKNSSFAPPPAAGTTPPDQAAGFADAAGVNR
ncbi:MAG: peptidoglycan-binding domain-containing protein [Terracidiphilus sp.]